MSKRIVIPGELVSAEPQKMGDHVFSYNGKIYSSVLGITDDTNPLASVVPLEGRYMPHEGDVIVGIVQREEFSGYKVDINSIYHSFISKKEFRYELRVGDVVSARIEYVNEINEAGLADVRTLHDGEVVLMSPVKVPRLIGKNSSMLNVLLQGTGSQVIAGRNGRIWIKNGDVTLLKTAIAKVESEAHTSNLTNKMTDFFKEHPRAAVPQPTGASPLVDHTHRTGGRYYE